MGGILFKRDAPKPATVVITEKPKKIPQVRLDRVVKSGRAGMTRLTTSLLKGKLTPDKWQERVEKLLTQKHERAVILGRQRAGDQSPAEADDRTFAELVMDGQRPFLDDFRHDIEHGELSDAQVLARARLYAERIVGTANEAFVLASDPKSKIWWVLGAVESGHCAECPYYAASSPFVADEMPAYPCDGSTTCGVKCKCGLRREDGVEGFKRTD